MSGGTPYIGSKIGLISKAQNRYEGILYTIDTANSTVVLAKVKCFGTEGRPTDKPTPPKDDIYEYIIFRGSDIKDITLCEPPKSHHGLPQDPAIVQSSIGSSSGFYSAQGPFSPLRMPSYNQLAASSLLNQQYAAALGLGPGLQGPHVRRGPMVEQAVQTVPAEKPGQKKGLSAPQDQQWESRRPQRTRRGSSQSKRGPAPTKMKSTPSVSSAQPRTQSEGNDENKPPPRRRQGARRPRNRSRGRLIVENSKPSTLKFETDFDFDSANAQFIKEELEREMQDKLNIKDGDDEEVAEKGEEAGESQSPEKNAEDDLFGPKCYYDKAKSFFDNISSDNVSRRTTWAQERKLNVETFGVPGRFIRGRGFRGGYRGRRGAAQRIPSQRAGSGRL